jgi:hypothetical protein
MSGLPYPISLPALADSQVTRVGVKSPEDVVVVSALRTALTKGRKGGFKDVLADGKVYLKGICGCGKLIHILVCRALASCL